MAHRQFLRQFLFPSLSSLSPLSFTHHEVSRTYPQLVYIHGRNQPKSVIVLVMGISVALADLGWDGPNAHLDEGLNVYYPCSLWILLEFSSPMAWASSCGRRCWCCQCPPAHGPAHPRLWNGITAQQWLLEAGLTEGLRQSLCPLLEPLAIV